MPKRTKVAPSGPGAGTTSCPWLIRARPGQRINLTIYNLDRQQPAPPVITIMLIIIRSRLESIAIENPGVFSSLFHQLISNLGTNIAEFSGEVIFLLQQYSVTVQRFNAVFFT